MEIHEDVNWQFSEIGYWLGEPFGGRGIATAVLPAMTRYAFENFDLVRLFGLVYEWNPASARVLERARHTYDGRLRKSVTIDEKIIDQLLYAIIRE